MPSPPSPENLDAFVLARGLPASPGLATGKLSLNTEDALKRTKSGEEIILVKKQTFAEDVPAMMASKGIVCLLGGLTCHAAIVARDLKKPCIVGCSTMHLFEEYLEVEIEGQTIRVCCGEEISVDGSSGEIFASHSLLG